MSGVRTPHADLVDAQRGTVTAETALASVAVVLMMAAVLAVGQLALAQVRVTDAAGAGARAAARGEDGADVADLVTRAAGPAARTTITVADGMVRVTARVPVRLVLPGRVSVTVQASAEGRTETPGDLVP